MSTLDEEDRREYYRIEDTIALEIRTLSAPEAAGLEVLQDASPLFNLLSELHLSEFESQHLLRQISERDRAIAAFLKSQNKRIDLLSQVVALVHASIAPQANRIDQRSRHSVAIGERVRAAGKVARVIAEIVDDLIDVRWIHQNPIGRE